jgi:DNA polymerase-1
MVNIPAHDAPMQTGKLRAIDGLHIVRRIYEAHPESDPLEKVDSALSHALASFRNLARAHQPTHLLAAFDYRGVTWRHELWPAYRQNRTPMPGELRDALPSFYERLGTAGMAVISVPGVEADDVIATAVTRWLADGRGEAVVASNDRHLSVLIARGARLWDSFKSEWHDDAWVQHKYGVLPAQMPDLLALTGDSSDGVPGVSGVGVKTAAKLLQSYGDLDGIMAGAGILKGTLGERLRQDRDKLAVSRRLVELKTDVTLGVSWNKLMFVPPAP